MQHKIRSFAKRERQFTPEEQQLFDTLWSKYGLSWQEEINLEKFFGRKAPTILEIGFGMGHALVAMAKQYPEHNFLGIEVYSPGVMALLKDLEKYQLTNVRVWHEDVTNVLKVLPDNSLEKVLLFFPDPWPKRKHHKRRLVQNEFVDILKNKLIISGILHIASDWEDYAQHVLKIMNQSNNFTTIDNQNFVRPPTKFEQKGKKLGHQIWDLVFVRD